MSACTPRIHGLAYQIGEKKNSYEYARGFEEAKLPNNPELWGWGNFFTTELHLSELFVKSAIATINAADIDPNTIDAAFLCSSRIGLDTGIHCDFVRNFCEQVGLSKCQCRGVTLDGCASFLSVIELAAAAVTSGLHRNVLIVTADMVQEHELRFKPYAIFSDGAASCIITSGSVKDGFEVCGSASATNAQQMFQDAAFSDELTKLVNSKALEKCGRSSDEIEHVFCNNLFLPVVTMKEMEGGVEDEVLYLDNVERIGHCFGADALINLKDLLNERPLSEDKISMLAADAPGSRTVLLLKSFNA